MPSVEFKKNLYRILWSINFLLEHSSLQPSNSTMTSSLKIRLDIPLTPENNTMIPTHTVANLPIYGFAIL